MTEPEWHCMGVCGHPAPASSAGRYSRALGGMLSRASQIHGGLDWDRDSSAADAAATTNLNEPHHAVDSGRNSMSSAWAGPSTATRQAQLLGTHNPQNNNNIRGNWETGVLVPFLFFPFCSCLHPPLRWTRSSAGQ